MNAPEVVPAELVPLPDGLWAVQRLQGAEVFGEVVSVVDRRLTSLETTVPRKVARILSSSWMRADWQAAVRERLRKLDCKTVPHLSLPNESWERPDGTLILIGRLHEQHLKSRIRNHHGAGLSVIAVDRLIGQLLAALAGLHLQQISHGDVRPANIFLDNYRGDQFEAWLIDVPIGTLSWITGGERQDPEARYFHPPEWQGELKAPDPRADLYALGLTILEVIAGQRANPARSTVPNEPASPGPLESLSRCAISPAAREVVARLLADKPEERWGDAGEVLRHWEKLNQDRVWWQGLRRWALLALAVVALLLLSRGWDTWQRSSERKLTVEKLEAENSSLRLSQEKKLDSQKEKLDGQEKKLDGQKEKLDQILEALAKLPDGLHPSPRPVEPPPVSTEERAKTFWKQKFAGRTSTFQKMKEGNENLEAMLGDSAMSSDLRKDVSKWSKGLRAVLGQPYASLWFVEDREFQKQLQRLADIPWEAGDEAMQRVVALNAAAKKWDDWAQSNMTFDELVSRELTLVDEDQKSILRDWLNRTKNLNQQPSPPKLRFVSGSSADWGTNRYIYSNWDSAHLPYLTQVWSSTTGHTYRTAPPVEENLVWKAGEPLRIIVEVDRSIYVAGIARNIINEKFGGPLALWLASKKKSATTGPNVLKFEIIDCPGPPPAVLKPLSLLPAAS